MLNGQSVHRLVLFILVYLLISQSSAKLNGIDSEAQSEAEEQEPTVDQFASSSSEQDESSEPQPLIQRGGQRQPVSRHDPAEEEPTEEEPTEPTVEQDDGTGQAAEDGLNEVSEENKSGEADDNSAHPNAPESHEKPIVFGINPANGPTKGETMITVTGANFGDGDSQSEPIVKVGGKPCKEVVWVSKSSILCVTPANVGAKKEVIVDVSNEQSEPTPDAAFSYDPPTVIAVRPGHGPAAGGTSVTIIGTNFGDSNSSPSATIGGAPCLSVVWLSPSELHCVTPPGVGIGDVRVFVLDQSSPENFGTIFEFDAPEVDRLVPDHGPSQGQFVVTVEGLNFGVSDSRPVVTVGGRQCRPAGWVSNTAIRCTVPAGSGDDKAVRVQVR